MGRPVTLTKALAVALALALTGAACGDDGDDASADRPAAPEPKRGGSLVWAVQRDVPETLKPDDIRGISGGEDRAPLIYDTLLLRAPDGSAAPNIATSMESTDGISWTMKLRPNVRFTDGTPLDAEAVRFNVDLHKDPRNGSNGLARVQTIDAMTVLDPQTITFKLKAADGNFPDGFVTVVGYIASPTAFRADPQGFGSKPVGAGPFMVQSYTRDLSLKLVRNPTYWDAPKPYLDAIEVRVMADDVTRGQAIGNKDIDVAANAAPTQAQVRTRSDVVNASPAASGGQAIVAQLSKEPGNDVRIRQAIALAIDPKLVNASLMQGTWTDDGFDCPPYSSASRECLKGYWPDHDLNRAKALVKQYTDSGKTLTGPYTWVASTQFRAESELIQQTLASIGIPISVKLLPAGDAFTEFLAGNFHFAYGAVPPSTGPPFVLYTTLHSKERFAQKGTPDPAVDALIERARGSLNPDDRMRAAQDLQRYLAREFPYIFFAPSVSGVLARSDVQFGDRFDGGPVPIGQDLWLDR